LRTYRRFLSVVSQDTILFDGSVYENITYGLKSSRSSSRRGWLCAMPTPWILVERLPQGLETNLGEKGRPGFQATKTASGRSPGTHP